MKVNKEARSLDVEATVFCSVLEKQLAEIRYVKDWAIKLDCSTKALQRVIKKYYGVTAKKKLKEIRFNTIKQMLRDNPEIGSYELAVTVGLKNEQEGYKFLSRNFDTSFSDLKSVVLYQK